MQATFSGLIAVILLGIYVGLISLASRIVHCLDHPSCTNYVAASFNDQMAFALSTIGGLVSALVIAQLAITTPGTRPGANFLGPRPMPRAATAASLITIAYVLVWLAAGLWSFITTVYHPTALPVLTDLTHAWLGIVVAAGYSYFGLHRQ